MMSVLSKDAVKSRVYDESAIWQGGLPTTDAPPHTEFNARELPVWPGAALGQG